MNILKALAQKMFGARSHHLLTLVFVSFHSIIDSGVAILNSARSSLFQKIKNLQTCVIRVALWLSKWIPIILLFKHAEATFIVDRIRVLAFG